MPYQHSLTGVGQGAYVMKLCRSGINYKHKMLPRKKHGVTYHLKKFKE